MAEQEAVRRFPGAVIESHEEAMAACHEETVFRIELTLEQKVSGYIELSEREASILECRLQQYLWYGVGARPAVMTPCPKCGVEYSAGDLRSHLPDCGGQVVVN